MSVRERATARHSSVPTQVLASNGVKTIWFLGDMTYRQFEELSARKNASEHPCRVSN